MLRLEYLLYSFIFLRVSAYRNVQIDLHGIHTKYLSVNYLASKLRHYILLDEFFHILASKELESIIRVVQGCISFQVFSTNFFTHILQVTLPQYQHLMAMEKKLMRLEAMMKKISDKSDPDTLKNNPKWNALIKMRDMLTKYVPGMPNPIEE